MQAVEQKYPCIRGCTPPLFLFSLSLQSPLSSLSPPISQLTTTIPSSYISTHFLLLSPSQTIILYLSLSHASGLLFQSAKNTPVLFGVSLLFFSRLMDCRGEEGWKEWERGGKGGGDISPGDAGQIPLLWGVLGIRDMVRPLEPSWFIAGGVTAHGDGVRRPRQREHQFLCFKSIFGRGDKKVTSVLAAF